MDILGLFRKFLSGRKLANMPCSIVSTRLIDGFAAASSVLLLLLQSCLSGLIRVRLQHI
jgi:hypothetical protein